MEGEIGWRQKTTRREWLGLGVGWRKEGITDVWVTSASIWGLTVWQLNSIWAELLHSWPATSHEGPQDRMIAVMCDLAAGLITTLVLK